MEARTIPVPAGQPSFLDAPRGDDLATLEADIAIIGVPDGVPYAMADTTSLSHDAPRTIREQSMRLVGFLSHYDFDVGGPVLGANPPRIVDCGDVAMEPGQFVANSQATTEVIAAILDRGAIPIVLGGDDSVPIPTLRAYEGRGDLCIVQLDAHLDWRDERHGVREGLSSPMRRASEMPWVTGMAQIGLRGAGSGRDLEFAAARAHGSVLIGAAEIHRDGVEAALAKIPAAARYYIAFDADALDPAIAPGVQAQAFGGLTYDEASNLLRGVARRGHVVGYDIVEVVPNADIGHITSRIAARLTLTLIGELWRQRDR
ncbi:MAG: arginase family protein [Chloroflexota bacterium]|nr:arginase family protein [Chloroflexota bacterium]